MMRRPKKLGDIIWSPRVQRSSTGIPSSTWKFWVWYLCGPTENRISPPCGVNEGFRPMVLRPWSPELCQIDSCPHPRHGKLALFTPQQSQNSSSFNKDKSLHPSTKTKLFILQQRQNSSSFNKDKTRHPSTKTELFILQQRQNSSSFIKDKTLHPSTKTKLFLLQ